ncbi:hypothetical protein LTR10_015265 [Elasticomyces elasticus]|uniref:Xylanolytic transcriptional activator regulatory domain-containing protein n=1 Tax=Exophiala sideris TaxID=1016849 RepID=A0ABR0JEB0_9EURO|nr:hypothetical protein LTR10_015265 [Elasticomyces elasticus]KAK5032740.1 hypothetical protein LTS07_004150 [Exophiala sideris]KAK5037080.1 hypothetical protein LTR13_004885 [Exophiala sideris]KAK5062264.1 hypothetical protein LTR69_004622 [Exophiala sideris]KAK5182238.1 hypothetical protein LTR44_005249 [Eurotiomycetes sp. CCFEE 6388]
MSSPIVHLLREKLALSAPSIELQNALWLAYLKSVHPFMPVLDAQSVFAMMQRRDGSQGQLSLLLFHAIMLAGLHSVDMEYLRKAGYVLRRTCLNDSFEVVKLLYDMDYEQDRMCLIQSLLLMTLWYRSPDDHKDPWHYVGLAVALARKTGLHQAPIIAVADPLRQPLLKRIWWCCVMRDYMIAHGMNRPVHIRLRECSTLMLNTSDFNDLDLATDWAVSTHVPMGRCRREGRHLAVLFVELLKLCRIGHEYLELEESKELHGGDTCPHTANNQVGPPNPTSEEAILEKVEAALASWYADLLQIPWMRLPFTHIWEPGDGVLVQHCSLLYMLYHTAVITVHRRHLMPPKPPTGKTDANDAAVISREKVRNAAGQVTSLCGILEIKGLIRGLPMPFMTCILITTIVQVLEIKFAGNSPQHENLRGLSFLTAIMKQVGTEVSYVDWSYKFLESACRTAKIQMPAADSKEEGPPSHDNVGNEQRHTQSIARTDSGAIASGDMVPVFGFTPPPEEGTINSPIPPNSTSLGFAAGIPSLPPSPFDGGLFDADFALMEHSNGEAWVFSYDAAGEDLPAGYGKTINTYLMDTDNFEQTHFGSMEDGVPSASEDRGAGYNNRMMDENTWLLSPIDMDRADPMDLSLLL